MPGVAAPEEWLRQQLLALSKQGNTALDPEMVHGLADYCARANEVDAAEYILNIVGDQASGIVDVYTAKRRSADGQAAPAFAFGGSTSAAAGRGGQAGDQAPSGSNLQAYIKPSLETVGVLGGKKGGKAARKGRGADETPTPGGDSEPTPQSEVPSSSEHLTNLGKIGRKKKNKGQLRVEDVAAGRVLLANRKLCDCQARRHRLVTNCLSCGKIVCEQEGEGPCMFCGALVSREGDELAPPQGETDEQLAVEWDAEEKARAFKDRLVEYDRTAAQRTAVIDDQSDFFQMDIDGDSWMSEEEKKKVRAQQALAAHAEREKRSKVQVTFDLIGRKVILAGDETQDADPGTSEATHAFATSSNPAPNPPAKIIPNPMLKGPPPIFIDTTGHTAKGTKTGPVGGGGLRGGTIETDGQSGKEPPGARKGFLLGAKESKGRPERVQHDSSYFGVIEPMQGGVEDEGSEVSDTGTGVEQEASGTVRLSGRDIDAEEFGSEPACGTSIPLVGHPVGKANVRKG